MYIGQTKPPLKKREYCVKSRDIKRSDVANHCWSRNHIFELFHIWKNSNCLVNGLSVTLRFSEVWLPFFKLTPLPSLTYTLSFAFMHFLPYSEIMNELGIAFSLIFYGYIIYFEIGYLALLFLAPCLFTFGHKLHFLLSPSYTDAFVFNIFFTFHCRWSFRYSQTAICCQNYNLFVLLITLSICILIGTMCPHIYCNYISMFTCKCLL